jgi:dipeptidyl aminopeptidase/acylaminoacyl peptidase
MPRPASPFAGKLDPVSVAVAGHSLDGLTALIGVEQEPRFKAGIVIDGVMPDRSAQANTNARPEPGCGARIVE